MGLMEPHTAVWLIIGVGGAAVSSGQAMRASLDPATSPRMLRICGCWHWGALALGTLTAVLLLASDRTFRQAFSHAFAEVSPGMCWTLGGVFALYCIAMAALIVHFDREDRRRLEVAEE